jgi:elongation factor G
MSKSKVDDIRNLVLVGHGAVGKTTLADLMLFKAGVGSRAGSVDDGTSVLDFDEEERAHKYSISSSLIHFQHEGKTIHLLDTPGYPDFIGQAIGAFRAVETAVIVINANSGIEVNTRRVFHLAEREGLGRVLLINKLDLENIRFEQLIENIQSTFGKRCVLMNVPNGLGTKFTDVIGTLEVAAGGATSELPLDPGAIHQQLMDAIVESDEGLMERYLNGEEFHGEELDHAVEHAIVAGSLIPILCMSARSGVGVKEFMDAIAHDFETPADLPRSATKGSDTIKIEANPDGPFVAQVFKTRIDPFVSKMSFLRIFSGKLAKDATVTNSRTGKTIKVAQLLRLQGGQQQIVDSAFAGDIAVVVKMDELQVGDTLTDGKLGDIKMPGFQWPTPMAALGIEPKSRNDQQKISGSLHKLEEEDQTFHATREAQTHELVVRGMSELHLKIIEERLKKRDKVEVITHPPRIPYRETVAGRAEGSYRHKKQSGGAGQFGEVHMVISALPPGVNLEEYCTKERFPSMREYHHHADGNWVFVDRISGGSVPNQFIPAIEKGCVERVAEGVIAGYHVQDVAVELFFGKAHDVDSNENAFRTAGRMCFKQLFQQAKPVLLEPIMKVEITVPGEKFGDITSDLNSRRGRVEGMDTAPGGFQVITAKVPLSEMVTYARSLSSMTGGQGSFLMEHSHYDIMPPNEQSKVVAAAAAHLKKDEE